MFSLQREPLEPMTLARPDAGGYVSFVGRVRNHHVGKAVEGLDYEAFDAMALAEGEKVVREAIERFGVLEARCIHRIGSLNVGDVAIAIEVAAGHRREAFRACEFIIDDVKRRVPIWKRERYADGVEEWVHAWSAAPEALTEEAYYQAQTRLPEVGLEGQDRLRGARVLVIGAGGLGCPAITYLASCGVGTILVADHDVLEGDNLHRQPLFRVADIGRMKADLAAEAVAALNPYVRAESHTLRLDASNAERLIAGCDLVLDCSDNLATKDAANAACVALGVPLVVAGIHRMEGWVLSVDPKSEGGCLRCLWPTAWQETRSCAEVGVLGFVPGVLGVFMATEAIKRLTGWGDTLGGRLWLVDLLRMEAQSVLRAKDPGCPVCSSPASLAPSEPIALKWGDPSFALGEWALVDLRLEPRIEFPLAWPRLSENELTEEGSGRRVLVVCDRGISSVDVVRKARRRGVLAWSLEHGEVGLRRALGR